MENQMTPLQESLALLKQGSKRQCKVAIWMSTLPEEDRKAVDEMFSLKDIINDSRLAQELAKFIDVSRFVVRDHRAQNCRCYR